MEEKELRALVTSTGLELLRDGLVARTWGNISARVDDTHFLITPSGLDYVRTRDNDLALFDMTGGEWTGPRKPSSEKGIHAAAYRAFPEVGFAIHTHQVYASAIGVAGFDKLDITIGERNRLGGIAMAEYGLPGTKKLKNAVAKVLEAGNHTVLMKNHGVLVAAATKEEAYSRALLLEEICLRNIKPAVLAELLKEEAKENADKNVSEGVGEPSGDKPHAYAVPEVDTGRSHTVQSNSTEFAQLLAVVNNSYPRALAVTSKAVIERSREDKPLTAQLDDMAQMIGRRIITVDRSSRAVAEALKTYNAVFVRDCGAVVNGRDEDDTEALKLLVEKAAVTDLNAEALGADGRLSRLDCALMHFVYTRKYSKKKSE